MIANLIEKYNSLWKTEGQHCLQIHQYDMLLPAIQLRQNPAAQAVHTERL
jgi:hypothetical protein